MRCKQFSYFWRSRFPEFPELHNFSERQVVWSLYSVVFHAFTLTKHSFSIHENEHIPEIRVFFM